jgi:FkbM family methyltransferase
LSWSFRSNGDFHVVYKVKAEPWRPAFLTRLSNGQRAWALARWVARLLEGCLQSLRGRTPRFWRLSPPVIGKQAIYDRLNGRIFSLHARDAIDLNLMGLIFDRNAYGFETLVRQDELKALHENILAQKLTPLIIDCGTHGGFATKFFSETYPRARIVALEPEEENFELAQANNAQDRISVLCAAIGNTDGLGRLIRRHNSLAHRIDSDPNGPTRILSVNSILESERRSGAQPFIVKIVIEGFEENLFEKNTDWIDAFPVLIIELHDGMLPKSGNARNFLREMAKRNRDFVHFGKNIFSISNTIG